MVGVSGGADSIGLLLILRELAREYDLHLHVVHLNHMLRPDAAADAAFVQQLAHQWGLPVTIGYARVRHIAERFRIGIEEAGRLARYRLFERVADRIGAQRIAVGHQANDQVETVLFNIMRGTGPGGLAGIPPRRGGIVRPLLCASREEIAAYCRTAGLDWRSDASNLDPEFLRNRIRHSLLPVLRRDFNPHIDQAILRLAEIVGEENRFFEGHTRSLLQRLLEEGEVLAKAMPAAKFNPVSEADAVAPGYVQAGTSGSRLTPKAMRLPLNRFVHLPLAIQRRLLRAVIRKAGGSLRHLGYQNIKDCLDFLSRGDSTGTVQLPHGVWVNKCFGYLTVAVSPAVGAGKGSGQPEAAARRNVPILLQVPGETGLPELGMSIKARLVNITPGTAGDARCLVPEQRGAARLWDADAANTAWFDYDCLELPLAVRCRQVGDCLRPFGMQGTKKLKKLFGEFRLPSSGRDSVPLVIDRSQIIWVVGLRRSQAAPVTRQTRRVLALEAEKL
ncbi:MAG: tRNA lysidine(34) synthetase TilS [Thermacetogeniaceae bacterium]